MGTPIDNRHLPPKNGRKFSKLSKVYVYGALFSTTTSLMFCPRRNQLSSGNIDSAWTHSGYDKQLIEVSPKSMDTGTHVNAVADAVNAMSSKWAVICNGYTARAPPLFL